MAIGELLVLAQAVVPVALAEAGAEPIQEPIEKQDQDRRAGVKDAGGTTLHRLTDCPREITEQHCVAGGRSKRPNKGMQ